MTSRATQEFIYSHETPLDPVTGRDIMSPNLPYISATEKIIHSLGGLTEMIIVLVLSLENGCHVAFVRKWRKGDKACVHPPFLR